MLLQYCGICRKRLEQVLFRAVTAAKAGCILHASNKKWLGGNGGYLSIVMITPSPQQSQPHNHHPAPPHTPLRNWGQPFTYSRSNLSPPPPPPTLLCHTLLYAFPFAFAPPPPEPCIMRGTFIDPRHGPERIRYLRHAMAQRAAPP